MEQNIALRLLALGLALSACGGALGRANSVARPEDDDDSESDAAAIAAEESRIEEPMALGPDPLQVDRLESTTATTDSDEERHAGTLTDGRADAPQPARVPRLSREGGRCTLVGTYDVGTSSRRRTPMGLFVDGAGGFVVYRNDVNEVSVRPIDSAGQPQGESVASDLEPLHHVSVVRRAESPAGIDLIGVADACGHMGSGCIVTAFFDANGRLRSPARVVPAEGSQWVEIRLARKIDGVLYAEQYGRWGNHLVRFDRSPHGELVHHVLTSTSDELAGAGSLGISWLLDVGGQPVGLSSDSLLLDSPRSVLIRPGGRATIEGLPLHQTLSVAALSGDEIGLLFRRAVFDDEQQELVARGGVRFARVGSDGRVREVTDATLSSLPEELGDVLHFAVERVGRRIQFVRTNALGQRIGETISIPTNSPRLQTPSVAFSGTHFVILHLEQVGSSWVVRTSSVRCDA